MIDLHQHPMVKPEDPSLLLDTYVVTAMRGATRRYATEVLPRLGRPMSTGVC